MTKRRSSTARAGAPRLSAALIAGSAALLPAVAPAQQDAGDDSLPTLPVPQAAAAIPDDDASTRPTLLEEVIVTARKRAEPLQDVPVSISAFNADQLDARGIQDVRDLTTAVPGLTVTDLGGYNLIYLRGIGTDIFIPSAEPSVATYLDGVYFPSGHSLAQAFGAIDRIEVLKGPQGTLFGRNSTGGAVSIWSRNPGQTAETSIQTSYAPRFDDTRTRVYTNLPLTSDVAASLSAYYNRADNVYRLDNGTGDHLPPEIGKGARIKLGIRLGDEVSLLLTGLAAQQRGTSTTASANVDPTPLLGATLPAETRDYVVTANSEPKLTTDSRAAYAILNWNHPGVDARLLGSYYFVRAHDYVYDFDDTREPVATYGADSEYQRFYTSELQFTSNADSWASSWLKWVGGLYYLSSEGGYDPGYLRLVDSVQLPISNIVSALPPALGSSLDALLGNSGLPESLTFYFTGLLKTESYSAYVQSTASLTDWLDLTLGGRWQREKRRLAQSDVDVGAADALLGYSFSPAETSATNFSPKVSLDFRPLQDVLLYASFQQGYKSGTYNIINIFAQPEYVKPEQVTAYELGLKTEWFAHSLRLNAAVFENDIKNLQTGFMSFTSGGAINLENAGRARIRGVEVETIWQPLRSFDPGLVVSGNGSWLDARYTDYENGRGFDESTGLAYGNGNFSGNRIVRTPKFSGTASISQSFALPGGQLEVAGDYYYNSGYYYLAQNTADTFEDAYGIVNARISYLYRRHGLRVTLFGDNLGDERYNLAQFHTDFGREDTLAPPRTWGLRLNWDF
ncbi:TonB-dependent receptor [Solimonas terrae]|uniref:TonB-dependent receptor n=1 Tax=Solimonas terrae TaxID=1396819 RepID=A0A6M2BVL2_9GAMM|nr:TonB-dependent receptor [Solimonas terrae]NGY06596.1 TonB-dependent receptor [Solimonas terrae]